MLSAGTGSSNYTVSGVPDRRAGDGGTREAGHVLHYGVSSVECRVPSVDITSSFICPFISHQH